MNSAISKNIAETIAKNNELFGQNKSSEQNMYFTSFENDLKEKCANKETYNCTIEAPIYPHCTLDFLPYDDDMKEKENNDCKKEEDYISGSHIEKFPKDNPKYWIIIDPALAKMAWKVCNMKCQNDRLVFNTRKAIADNTNAIKENKKTNKEQDKEIKDLKDENKELKEALRKIQEDRKKDHEEVMNRFNKLEKKDVEIEGNIEDLQQSSEYFEENIRKLWERNAIIEGDIQRLTGELNKLASVTHNITVKLNYPEELKKLKEPLKLGRDHTSFCDEKDNWWEEPGRWTESFGKEVVDRDATVDDSGDCQSYVGTAFYYFGRQGGRWDFDDIVCPGKEDSFANSKLARRFQVEENVFACNECKDCAEGYDKNAEFPSDIEKTIADGAFLEDYLTYKDNEGTSGTCETLKLGKIGTIKTRTTKTVTEKKTTKVATTTVITTTTTASTKLTKSNATPFQNRTRNIAAIAAMLMRPELTSLL
uniref:Uncharacterized protein n=1 Tax=Meloidogyne javanica TaxID=6303 RepID=A0A915MGI4_MELJA